MSSIAEKLKARGAEEIKENDPEAFVYGNYLIDGIDLDESRQCGAIECQYMDKAKGRRYGRGEPTDENDSDASIIGNATNAFHVFCFTCGRLGHALCMQFNMEESLQEEQALPWMCAVCRDNPRNTACLAFSEAQNYLVPLWDRANSYRKATAQKFRQRSPDDTTVTPPTYQELLAMVAQNQNEQKRRDAEFQAFTMEQRAEVERLREEVAVYRKSRVQFGFSSSSPKRKTGASEGLYEEFLAAGSSKRTPAPPRAPLPKDGGSRAADPPKRKTLLDTVNIANLTITEKFALETAQAQLDAAAAQVDAAAAQKIMSRNVALETTRKALPKIAKFDGDPTKWLQFLRDIELYRTVGEFEELTLKMHIRNALAGAAYSCVREMIDSAPLSKVMRTLENKFGQPTRIIERAAEEILTLRFGRTLFKEDVVTVTTKITTYFEACDNANIGHANSHQLASHLFEQLNAAYKMMYRDKYDSDESGESMVDLETLHEFLEKLYHKVESKKPDKPQTRGQVHAVQTVTSQGNNSPGRGDSYEIREKTSEHCGYDMNALSEVQKKCEACNSRDHYTVECSQFKQMDGRRKSQFIREKRLCRCCLVSTSHMANDCQVRNGCGYKFNGHTCGMKHHKAIHRLMTGANGNARGNGNSRNYQRNDNQNNRPVQNNAVGNGGSASSSSTHNAAPGISQLPRQQTTSPFVNPNVARQLESHSNRSTMNTSISVGESSSRIEMEYELQPYDDEKFVSPLALNEIKRTVKVFRNNFLGDRGFVTGHSVGDSAAEVSLMRDDLRKSLGLHGESCSLTMQYADGSMRTIPATKVTLRVQGLQPDAVVIKLNNVYAIADLNLPKRSLNVEELKRKFQYLRNVEFESYRDVAPLLLLGSPHASVFESRGRLYEDRKCAEGKPVGLLAKLGWSIYGGDPEDRGASFSVQSIHNEQGVEEVDEARVSNEDLNEMLCYVNSIDSLGIRASSTQLTEDEEKAIAIVREELRALDDGSLETPLAWNRVDGVIPFIPNNFKMVLKRQLAQETKLKKNPAYMKAFNDNFIELLSEGYVRPANENDFRGDWPNISYLPMSLVINKNKDPPKFRNVFDASAKYMGTSLNAHLLKGPDLLIDQLRPLLQMRADRIAITADVKAMFMRVKINVRDQQVQRVLWRESESEEMRVYIVTSMLFGPTCSPFVSQYVKNVTADQWSVLYSEAARLVKECVYMDDLLFSTDDLSKATHLARECIRIFASINMHLVSFQSNSREFLKTLPIRNVKAEAITSLENENESLSTKVLGCQWDTREDCFTFKFDKNVYVQLVKESAHHPTKREQCSSLARIYDIFGFIVPHTIRGKILIQRSWMDGTDWDQPISQENYKLWKEWIDDIENVAQIKVRRKYNERVSLSQLGAAELHTFCDAGGEAFAAVSYIVTTHRGTRSSNIAMARAKVTPIRLKSKTLVSQMPRLELYACLIASRLADTVSKHLSSIKLERYFWTDSQVALRWITNPNHKLIKYAIAPVEEILDKTKRSEWRYVPSRMNVADKATKFVKIDFADSSAVWFTGPGFLQCDAKHWPTIESGTGKDDVVDELAEETFSVNVINIRETNASSHVLPTLDSMAKEHLLDSLSVRLRSRFWKLVRATARALKMYLDAYIPLVMAKKSKDAKAIKEFRETFNFDLTPKDLERAEHFLIRKAQRECFPEEYEKLQKGQPISNRELAKLHVFMDEEGLIRIDSRVELDDQFYPQRFAPLVPRRSSFADLLLEQVHYDYRHIHKETQIAYIRSKYWIPQLRAAVNKVKGECNFCRIIRSKPYAPMMAPLPECRIDPRRAPFETVGVDCLGPITVKNFGRDHKYYVMIFVCTLTRFVHLHLLESLESVQVLEAITIFWAAHGPAKRFISDRGTNFVGAARMLKTDRDKTIEFFKQFHADQAEKFAQKYHVEWQMIPAHSPWMGGMYERFVKEVKRSIAAVLENKKTTKRELNIALHDAAHRINCRPLTHNAVESEDAPILTPHDLAKNRSGFPFLPGLPDGEAHHIRHDAKYYRRGRLIADEIFRRFTLYYLPVLTKRTKWFDDFKSPIKIGDLVLLIEPNDTRKDWRRARVLNLYKGRDGKQRVADVILPDGTIRKARSIQRLAKLDIQMPESN